MFIMGIVLDYSNVWPDARQSCNEDSLGVTVKNLLGWEPVSIVHYTWPGCPFVFSDLTYNL